MHYSVKETNNFFIEYPNKNDFDIETVSHEVDDACIPVLNFFNISSLEKKTKAKLWDSLDDFRNLYIEAFKREPSDWLCGFVYNGGLQVLTLDEHRKTNSHENDTLSDLIKIIIHEFVHNVHSKITNVNKLPKWVSEGIACFLSHQYDDRDDLTLKASLEQVMEGGCAYTDYYLMMKQVISTNDREYVMKILTNSEFSYLETEKIYSKLRYSKVMM